MSERPQKITFAEMRDMGVPMPSSFVHRLHGAEQASAE
jgi:hypothetical protein